MYMARCRWQWKLGFVECECGVLDLGGSARVDPRDTVDHIPRKADFQGHKALRLVSRVESPNPAILLLLRMIIILYIEPYGPRHMVILEYLTYILQLFKRNFGLLFF